MEHMQAALFTTVPMQAAFDPAPGRDAAALWTDRGIAAVRATRDRLAGMRES